MDENSATKHSGQCINFFCEQSCKYDIVKSIGNNSAMNNIFSSVSDRYYEHKYCIEIPDVLEKVHQKISFHTNRVCLVSLAENHPVMKENKDIIKLNFQINEKLNRLQNKVSGKSKRGAQKLNKNSIICYIECSDNTIYPVYSCIDGKLVEINDKLANNPNLLKVKPERDGYIALLLPILSLYDELKSSMLTKEHYFNNY